VSSNLAHTAFRLGFFIVFVSGILLLFLENGSAEQAIMIFTFLVGLLFLTAIVILVRLGQRKP
jgi:uncharacterized membrane protein